MPEIILRGLELALFGMGTVFVFLTMLVLTTMAMSRLVRAFAPIEAASDSVGSAGVDERTLAAIGAAVRRYRADHIHQNRT